MNTSRLSVGDALSSSWRTFKSRPLIFVKAEILLVVIALAFSIVTGALDVGGRIADTKGMAGVAIILALASSVITLLSIYVSIVMNNMGVIKFYLTAHDFVGSVKLRDLWAPHPFWNYVGTAVLLTIIVFVGLLLLVVPGVIASLMFFAAPYLVMERHLSPIEALKESARMTRGNRWNIFLLGLAIVGINILGALALLVGLLVTVPLSFLACAHAYRTLAGGAHGTRAV
ncbi:DUF975 family protein [Candidatus Parcubacteria bacterium]|nr:DUF975 family protein [Candidatus Parcubacteria bacterium]